jgi:hypothetical protein
MAGIKFVVGHRTTSNHDFNVLLLWPGHPNKIETDTNRQDRYVELEGF